MKARKQMTKVKNTEGSASGSSTQASGSTKGGSGGDKPPPMVQSGFSLEIMFKQFNGSNGKRFVEFRFENKIILMLY